MGGGTTRVYHHSNAHLLAPPLILHYQEHTLAHLRAAPTLVLRDRNARYRERQLRVVGGAAVEL